MAFSYEDFLLYTKASDITTKLFATIAPGVIEYVETFYNIVLERNSSFSYKHFLRTTNNNFDLKYYPVNSLTSITYDGAEQSFSYYGDDVELTTAVSDVRIPLVITADVGFDKVPQDLKLAIYAHIESVYFSAMNSTDNISKVINTDGNTVYYREDNVPKMSKVVYDKYSPRLLAWFE